MLQKCMKQKEGSLIRQVHLLIVGNSFGSVTVLCDHLIRSFATCGSLFEANLVFCNLVTPVSHSWQAIISAHVTLGENERAVQLYEEMQERRLPPCKYVLSCALKACTNVGNLCEGRSIHDYLAKVGIDGDVVLGSSLIDMYGRSGVILEARRVFDKLPEKNVVCWGAIITSYTLENMAHGALEIFESMQEQTVEPDQVTLLCVLKACGNIGALQQGRIVHNLILKGSHETDMTIGNTLVDLYARCGSLEEAQRIFELLPHRNVVSYGAMLAGYAQSGHGHLALEFFHQMQLDDVKPNKVVHMCVLKACGTIGALDDGMLIHGQILDNGIDVDVLMGSTLIDMYAKCGGHEEACRLLRDLPGRDVISWGSVISGFAQDGHGLPALELFDRMQREGVKPDNVSIVCALKACGAVGCVNQARLIHKEVIRNGLIKDTAIGNILVDVYAKCGSLEDSHKVLETLHVQDIVSWNALIAGYANYGQCGQVDQCLANIQKKGFKPDDKTYTSILAGCSHAGLTEQGHFYFNSVEQNMGNLPGIEVYSCMADLFGRSGCLKEALDLLYSTPNLPEIILWKSLLTSCRTYKNFDLGKWAFHQMCELDTQDAFAYVLMSNMYADANIWEKVVDIQDIRSIASAGKKPGTAWIKPEEKVYKFNVNSSSSPLIEEMQGKLLRLGEAIRRSNHLPELDLVCDQAPKGG
ncbi:hypothetical protein KP509_04G068300 [Ceratopteris richardii]|nr:hypothetical protein KP509_04G068300 [Ceratopteris richardii]